MNVLLFTILVWLGGVAAGLLGSLTGLGGGVVIIPLLTLVFGVDIHYALGASLISVIATSSGAASAYVREGRYATLPTSRCPRKSLSFVPTIRCTAKT